MPQTGKPEGQDQAQLCSEFEVSLNSTKPDLRRANLNSHASENAPGDPECPPASLHSKVLCGAVIQAGKPGRLRRETPTHDFPASIVRMGGDGPSPGSRDLWPMPVFCVLASKDKKGFGKQSGRSAVPFPFVLADTALWYCSAPGSPSLQVLGFQHFQLPQLGL